jgi:signal transduction histidine kinase
MIAITDALRARRSGPRPALEPRTTPKPLSVLAWIGLTVVAVAIFWISVPTLVGFYELPIAVAFGTATVQCGTILLVVSRPRTATALHLLAIAGVGVATELMSDKPWPMPLPSLIALSAFICVVGFRHRWTTSIALWWLVFAVLVVLVLTNPRAFTDTAVWGYDLLITVTVTLVVLVLSITLGQRRHIRDQLNSARRDVELEQAKRQSVEERARIARELHDVVAHSMSIVHVQAMSASFRITDLPPAGIQEFEEIARTAQTALREMRQLLGALRPGNDVEVAPQPQLKDLIDLAEGASLAGTEVTIEMESDVAGLPPIVQLTAYRVVQEALSNVVRHAPDAKVDVEVDLPRPNLVRIRVVNGRPGRNPGPARVSPDTGGLGLRGMRERVALLEGTLRHGPTPEGGFAIEAAIPLNGYQLDDRPDLLAEPLLVKEPRP